MRGFQGDATFRDKRHVIATLKHFVGHGQPESGMNCAPANVSMRVLRETFLFTFKQALQKGGAISVMASYNEIDGVPSHANKWLLRDVLRKEWGFKGYVVGDYYAIWELGYRPGTHGHFVAKDKKESCALAVQAGVNIELPEPDCYLHLVELVKKGVLKESQLDDLVAPMLFWKFQMGLFDDPYVDPAEAERVVGCERNAKLAHQAAREAITLLKNENNLLPLNLDNIGSIAVIGPNANRSLLGGYSGAPKRNVTVLDGIKAKVGSRAKVLYSEGCKITIGGSWQQDEVVPSDPEEDRRQIKQAVRVAKHADVIVLAIGGNEQTSREAWMLNHMGDRTSLDLIGRQEELVRAMIATGKPVIVLLFNGRPISINYVSQNVPAIFECWYLGQETGHAIADVLFGDFNRDGRQPRREAAHDDSALGGSFARLLQLQTIRPPRLLVRRCVAAVRFRLRVELHDVRHSKRPAGEEKDRPRRLDSGPGGGDEHGRARGIGSGPDVCARSGQFGDPAGQGVEGFPASLFKAGRNENRRPGHRARVARVLRREHEVCRRAGRVRNHGGQFVARLRFAESGVAGGEVIAVRVRPDYE